MPDALARAAAASRSDPTRPLRVGVMLDSEVVPRWVAWLLEQIVASDFAELALVVLNDESQPERTFRSRVARFRRLGLYSLYHRLDYRRYRSSNDAFEPVDASPQLETAAKIRVVPLRPKPFEHRFDDETLARIRDAELDVMLRFGFAIIRGEILDCARYGVWSYHHGDNRVYRGGPALFWEIYEGNPVSGTVLQVLTDELDAGHVIYRSSSATDLVSLYRNRNATYWKTASFVLRRLRDLYEDGWESIRALETFDERVPAGTRIYRTPSNPQMARFFWRLGRRLGRRVAQRTVSRAQWLIGYRRVEHPTAAPLADGTPFRELVAPRERFYADPFVVARDGRHYVFFEDYEYASDRGRISFVELVDGEASPVAVALERPYHLSYPFVFEHEGELYMLPETAANGAIELYRAVRFPDEWVLDRVLLEDLGAVDPTLLRHDGKLWLFVNAAVSGGSIEDELSLYFADSLDGPWTPHPRNPVVSDVTGARPAGRILEHRGELIRPAQDSSTGYGGAISLNRIEVLTEHEYREVRVGRIKPTWAPRLLGTHCYTTDGTYEVIDGYRRRLRFGRR